MCHASHNRLRAAALIGVLTFALALTGCTRLQIEDVFSGVVDPSIVPAAGVIGEQMVERSFDFEDSQVRLQVPVDNAVYAGAQAAEKTTIFIGRSKPANWVDDHYRSFINEEHQDPFFESVLGALHAVREEQALDESEYVELVTSMAQSLEYRVDPGSLAPKFPLETFADGYGDCDDKTLLAAAILARDGYDVALLFFEPEKHVSLGIRAPGLDFHDTGYAYVEMTQPSLVGIAPQELSGGVKLESKPAVTRIGSGQSSYTAGETVTYIEKRLKSLRAKLAVLADTIEEGKAELDDLKADLDSANRDIRTAGSVEAGNAARERYNALVVKHNDLLAELNKTVARHNGLVEMDRYAIDHQHARREIYRRLKAIDL